MLCVYCVCRCVCVPWPLASVPFFSCDGAGRQHIRAVVSTRCVSCACVVCVCRVCLCVVCVCVCVCCVCAYVCVCLRLLLCCSRNKLRVDEINMKRKSKHRRTRHTRTRRGHSPIFTQHHNRLTHTRTRTRVRPTHPISTLTHTTRMASAHARSVFLRLAAAVLCAWSSETSSRITKSSALLCAACVVSGASVCVCVCVCVSRHRCVVSELFPVCVFPSVECVCRVV